MPMVGGFTCPVGPQKRIKITGFDFKIYAAQCLDTTRIGF